MTEVHQPKNYREGVLYEKRIDIDVHGTSIDLGIRVERKHGSERLGGSFDVATMKALREALKVAIKKAKKNGRSLRC